MNKVFILNPQNLSRSEQVKLDKEAREDFWIFMRDIFSESFDGNFIGGNFVKKTCKFLEKDKKTVRISAKDHFKSTSLYAHFAWNLWKCGDPERPRNLECHYFSYERKMAAYHLNKLKEMLGKNPWFIHCHDLKIQAESILKYTWDGKHIVTLKPHGMLAFKRGIHCDGVYVDDPFQDPENKLDPVKVSKINRIFVAQIMDMPKKGGFLHVVGTPQTNDDFFFDKNLMKRFKVKKMPAIISDSKKQVLWKEHMDYGELMIRKHERGERIFNQEYLVKPFYSEHAWFKKEKIVECVNPALKLQFSRKTNNIVSLGMDIGKKVHPSHISIFERMNNIWVQVYHEFMDNVPYNQQLNQVNDLWKRFNVDYGFFDATRGEFESFMEKNLLPKKFQPITFKSQTKFEIATNFDKLVTEKRVMLLDDQRMINQILVVDTNLNALETNEGHGESFWSIALALSADFKIKPERRPILKSVKKTREGYKRWKR